MASLTSAMRPAAARAISAGDDRVEVMAVEDDPDRHALVGEERAGRAGGAVEHRRHRVEQVRGEARTGVDRARRRRRVRIGVADGHDDAGRHEPRDGRIGARAARARA